MKILVFIEENDPFDPLIFKDAGAFKDYCQECEFVLNGDPNEWKLMFERLKAGDDWADHCCAVVWREVQ